MSRGDRRKDIFEPLHCNRALLVLLLVALAAATGSVEMLRISCQRLTGWAAKSRGQALPLNFVRIWFPLRGHGAAARSPAICPRPRPVRDRSTSANCPQTQPVHDRELSVNRPRPWTRSVPGKAAAKSLSANSHGALSSSFVLVPRPRFSGGIRARGRGTTTRPKRIGAFSTGSQWSRYCRLAVLATFLAVLI
jgi:hypothetical protein